VLRLNNVRIEPGFFIFLLKDNRHTIMELSYQSVRLGRDNRIAPDFLASLLVRPDVIKACKTKYFLIF
jgi:hypothetical protein